MSGRVLQHLLQYLYTGSCHFPQDDLNLGVELVGVADQFLLDPMKLQCEKVLSSKIDIEVRTHFCPVERLSSAEARNGNVPIRCIFS